MILTINFSLCKRLTGLLVLSLFFFTFTPLQIKGVDQQKPIESHTEAITHANNITGFDLRYDSTKSSEFEIAVISAKFIDTTTPFISESLNGRSSWKISYPIFNLYGDSCELKKCDLFVTSDIWLDSSTGQILQVKINEVGKKPAKFRLPTTQEAENQFAIFMEKFHGLPSVPPLLSLEDILIKYKKELIFSEEITIQYLIYSGPTTIPIPAWVITMRGGALAFLTVEAPLYTRVTQTLVIDAMTGRGFGIVNIPFPRIDKDSIK